MDMQVLERRESRLRTELKSLFDQAGEIEGRYEDGVITKKGDQKELKGLLKGIQEEKGKLDEVTESLARRRLIGEGIEKYGARTAVGVEEKAVTPDLSGHMTLGDFFYGSPEYKAAHDAGAFNGSRVPDISVTIEGITPALPDIDAVEEMKAGLPHGLETKVLYSGSGSGGTGIGVSEPFESRQRPAGFLPLLYAERTFSRLFRRVGTNSELIEYVKESSFTNAAAMIDEASATSGTSGTKPESTMAFTVASSTVKDIAHWMAVTNKMLRNAPAMRGIINQRLRLGLDLIQESQLVSGDGTGNNLTGLLNQGIQVQALGSDNIFDAIHKGMTKVRVTGLGQVNMIAMHPTLWETIRLTREDNAVNGTGMYLFGPPSMATTPTLWGLPVTLTHSLAAGVAIVGDRSQATVFDRLRTVIRTGLINDQFTRNMQTILAEMALAFIVWRPDSFCQVTGLDA